MIAVTTDILAAIDGAVRDWETSADAMRWSPEPVRLKPPPPVWMEVMVDVEGFHRAITGMAETVNQMARGFSEANQSLARALANMGHTWDARDNPKAHVRCARCHPCANPGPMLGVKPSLPRGRRHRRRG